MLAHTISPAIDTYIKYKSQTSRFLLHDIQKCLDNEIRKMVGLRYQ